MTTTTPTKPTTPRTGIDLERPATMKAIRYQRYGSPDNVELVEIDVPSVADDKVLVRVHAASVNPLDWHYLRGEPYVVRASAGLTKPKDEGLGADLAGRVEAIGSDVTDFRPGDDVFGMSVRTLAEYVRVSAQGIVPKPEKVTFEEAAAVPVAAITALQGLRDKGGITAGQDVLVNGASGGVGHFAVQIAASFGARVTGVCSGRNVDMVRSLGAERVIDYAAEDFTRMGHRYELIFDAAGNRSIGDLRRALTPDGTLVICGAKAGRWVAPFSHTIQGAVISKFSSQHLRPFLAHRRPEDLAILRQMLEAGTLVPVIDRRYPLGEAADALRYLEAGHARGKVVITM
jgi:NADPH:quinone reductase-like Zn-dependent oxidoreductase